MNFVSTDSAQLFGFVTALPYLICVPIQTIVVLIILSSILGWAFVSVLVILVITFYFNIKIS